MTKWKNEQRGGLITASNIRLGKFKLSVHQYIGHGRTLFASCYGLFEMKELDSCDFEAAQYQALSMLKKELEDSLQALADVTI